MIDKRIGKRFKQCRERLGLTQEELSEKTGLTTNYISTVERGASFPRCEKLVLRCAGTLYRVQSLSTFQGAVHTSERLTKAHPSDGRADDPAGKRKQKITVFPKLRCNMRSFFLPPLISTYFSIFVCYTMD